MTRDRHRDAIPSSEEEPVCCHACGSQTLPRLSRRRLVGGVAGVGAALAHAVVPHSVQAVAISGVKAVITTPDGSSISMRSCPSSTCSVVRTIPYGARIYPTEARGHWFKTNYGTATGWVNSWNTVLQGTPSREIYRGNTSRPMMALTFDAGADLGYTELILDTLRREQVLSSWGPTGRWVTANPDYARRVVADGHHLFNHTYTHGSFTTSNAYGTPALSPARRLEELQQAENVIIRTTGQAFRPYWRPPYGDRNAGVLRDVGAFRFSQTLMWGIDTLGWKGASAQEICNRTLAGAGNGVIVLMHVGLASADAQALPCIISGLRARGFSFGTIPQVLAP